MREHRVFGPPGAGKTTYLKAQIERAVERFGPQSVIVISFTRAAAANLVERGLPIPKERIGTLHSFAWRAAGAPKILEVTAEAVADWNNISPPEYHVTASGDGDAGIVDPFGVKKSAPKEGGQHAQRLGVLGFARRIPEEYVRLRNKLEPRDRWPEPVRTFAEKFEAWKSGSGLVDFTDLIERAARGVTKCPFHARVMFVDEAQDLTALELAVVRRWGEECAHWILAGDDQQAIYGFRGATPDAFLDPPLPPDQKTILGRSYRLPEAIRAYACAYGETLSRFERKDFAPNEQGGKVEWLHGIDSSSTLPLVRAISAAKGTSMVLASSGYVLEGIITRLREMGIPFHNPFRQTEGAWNPMRGGPDRLQSFLKEGATWREVWRWLEHIDAKQCGMTHGAKSAVEAVAKDEKEGAFVASALDWKMLTGIDWPQRSIEWFSQNMLQGKRKFYEFALRVVREGRSLSATPDVIVGTIHSVKGGEADNVFLMPDLSRAAHVEKSSGQEGRDAIVRVFYVGMTRARHNLFLLDPRGAIDQRLPHPAPKR